MNIGIDVSAAVYGTGVSDYVVNLVNNLPQKDLKLLGYSLRRGGELRRLFPQVKVFPFPPLAMHYLWNVAHQVPVEWLVSPIDVYHSSDWTQAPAKAAKVTTVHDLSPFLYPQEHDARIVAVHRARMKWVINECDRIICVSENTASDLRMRFKIPDSRVEVICEALPARFMLEPRTIRQSDYIVTVGARQPRKNITRLVKAFLQYKDKYGLPPKLVVMGERPNNQVTTDQVTYTGYVSDQDLVDYLAAAKVFVYPSLYEGFGLPILGGFYHGVPVACSHTSSLPEVAGRAAVLFDPYSEEAIARGIATAIRDRHRLIAAGKKQLAKFSWAAAARRTLAVYKSLA